MPVRSRPKVRDRSRAGILREPAGIASAGHAPSRGWTDSAAPLDCRGYVGRDSCVLGFCLALSEALRTVTPCRPRVRARARARVGRDGGGTTWFQFNRGPKAFLRQIVLAHAKKGVGKVRMVVGIGGIGLNRRLEGPRRSMKVPLASSVVNGDLEWA